MRKFIVPFIAMVAMVVSTIGCTYSRTVETEIVRRPSADLPEVPKPDPLVEMRKQIASSIEMGLKPINERLTRLEQARQVDEKQKAEVDRALDHLERLGFTVDRAHGKVIGIQGQKQVTPAEADALNRELAEFNENLRKKGYQIIVGATPIPPPAPDKR